MSATALTVAQVVEAGVTFSPASADTSNGNSFDNTNGDVFVICQNTHATNSETFNFAVQNQPPSTQGYGTVSKTNPLAIVVPALGQVLVGPFPRKAYNDGNNLVQMTYSGTGTPKVQAFRCPALQGAGLT